MNASDLKGMFAILRVHGDSKHIALIYPHVISSLPEHYATWKFDGSLILLVDTRTKMVERVYEDDVQPIVDWQNILDFEIVKVVKNANLPDKVRVRCTKLLGDSVYSPVFVLSQ